MKKLTILLLATAMVLVTTTSAFAMNKSELIQHLASQTSISK